MLVSHIYHFHHSIISFLICSTSIYLAHIAESFPRIWNHDSERQQCIVEDFDSQRRNKSVSRLLSPLLFGGEGKEGTAAAAADDDAGKATVIVAVVVSAENSDG